MVWSARRIAGRPIKGPARSEYRFAKRTSRAYDARRATRGFARPPESRKPSPNQNRSSAVRTSRPRTPAPASGPAAPTASSSGLRADW